jgi:ubiquitin carboxyl-terminal hydrolase 9/24
MTVLRCLLQKFPHLKKRVGQKLIEPLVKDFLFQIPQGADQGGKAMNFPKCKNSRSRVVAMNLLAVLTRDCLENLNYVLDFMKDYNQNASWRTKKDSDWNIMPSEDEKSSSGYLGIKNLGCICYMISLFQQLFSIETFRNSILEIEDPNNGNEKAEDNMFYQFQSLFLNLAKSEKQYANPRDFTQSFKDWEGQPINVFEQMDVDEFLQQFTDRLENAIKGTPQEKTIQYHFGGQLSNEMICQDCPHRYEKTEPCLNISLDVKNKRNIYDGLNSYIEGDLLAGDNAYYCEKCDKKIDTIKRQCIKKLPRYMIVTLKRLEFDFERMIRVKVND